MDQVTVAIIGAGGKMGFRAATKLNSPNYRVLLFNKERASSKKLQDLGEITSDYQKAIPECDVVLLAVPDAKIKEISEFVFPLLKQGALLLLFDASAAYIGEVTIRQDCGLMIAHPCHPALFAKQDSIEAYYDFFGGKVAKQDIVVSLITGDAGHYNLGKNIASIIFAPVGDCFELTLEQMVLLEPVASEIANGSVGYFIRDLFKEVIKRGVPRDAARSFLLGHLQVVLAMCLGVINDSLSDACQVVIKNNFDKIINPLWKNIFEESFIKENIKEMLHPKINNKGDTSNE